MQCNTLRKCRKSLRWHTDRSVSASITSPYLKKWEISTVTKIKMDRNTYVLRINSWTHQVASCLRFKVNSWPWTQLDETVPPRCPFSWCFLPDHTVVLSCHLTVDIHDSELLWDFSPSVLKVKVIVCFNFAFLSTWSNFKVYVFLIFFFT